MTLQGVRDPDDTRKTEGLMAISNVGLQEIIEHPFGAGQLITDGVQYSSPATSGTASGYATAVLATANPPNIGGQIYELEFGLTAAFRQDATASSTVTWQWQARSLTRVTSATVGDPRWEARGSWRNLHASDGTQFAAEATAYVEDTKSGRLDLDPDLDRFPIELQLLIKSDEATDAVTKAKNSSYVKAITSTLYRRAID